METNTTESETTIVVFQDNGLESNGDGMLTQIEYSEDGDASVAGSDKNNGTFLVPENFISQNSILGKDFVINCTPCNKIFVSADGYNSHIQNKECADGNNTAILAEVSQEHVEEVYATDEEVAQIPTPKEDTENMSDNTNGTTEKINMECADVKQQTEETIQSSKELEKTQEYVSNNGVQDATPSETTKGLQNIASYISLSNGDDKDDSTTKQKSIDILEKMTRRLYECPYCKETFPSTEILKSHVEIHLSEEDTENISIISTKEESNNEFITTETDVDFHNEFPDVFKKTVRISLERVVVKEDRINEAVKSNGVLRHDDVYTNGLKPRMSAKCKKVYCLCRKPRRRGMIGCDYCEEWFHPECLSLSTEEASSLTEMKWKCQVCDGMASINYEEETRSKEVTMNCKGNEDLSILKSQNDTTTEKQMPTDHSKRTKVHVGPAEWMWLVGDQLIAPTTEEKLLERKKRPSLEEDLSAGKRLKRNWANHRCRRCGEEFVSKASMRDHDCGMWKPRKEDWGKVVRESGYDRPSNSISVKNSPKINGVIRQCTLCDKTYDKLSNLKNHFVNHFKDQLFARLPDQEPYNCPECKSSRNVRDKITLMRHYAYTHGVIYEYCTSEDINGKILEENHSDIV